MKSKQSPRVPFCLHFVHVYLPFPWYLLLKDLPFSVTVISSGYAAARGVCKHGLVLGTNPEQFSKLLYLSEKISSYSPTSRICRVSLERATAVREEVRHNSTAFLLLFVNWIVVAPKALCQIRVKMCKPLGQTQPPTLAIQTMVPQGTQDPAKLLSRKATTFGFFKNYLLFSLLALFVLGFFVSFLLLFLVCFFNEIIISKIISSVFHPQTPTKKSPSGITGLMLRNFSFCFF